MQLTNPLDTVMDRVYPLANGQRSWSDTDWDTLYCDSCGAEADVVDRTPLTWRVRCPDCEQAAARKLRPIPHTAAALGIMAVLIGIANMGGLAVLIAVGLAAVVYFGVWPLLPKAVARIEEVAR